MKNGGLWYSIATVLEVNKLVNLILHPFILYPIEILNIVIKPDVAKMSRPNTISVTNRIKSVITSQNSSRDISIQVLKYMLYTANIIISNDANQSETRRWLCVGPTPINWLHWVLAPEGRQSIGSLMQTNVALNNNIVPVTFVTHRFAPASWMRQDDGCETDRAFC